MNDPRLIYTPRSDVTPEDELNALAAVYKFLLDRHVGKDAADRSTPSHKRKEVSDARLKK